jgi:hypothetical protein
MSLNDNQNKILINICENLEKEDINNFLKIAFSVQEFYNNQKSNEFGKFLEVLYLEGFLKINIDNIDISKEQLNIEEAKTELEKIKEKIEKKIEEVKFSLGINIFNFYKYASIIEKNIDICFIKALYEKGLEYQSKLSYDFENGKEKILNNFLKTYHFGNKMFKESLSKEVEELKKNYTDFNERINESISLLKQINENPSLLKEKIK